MYVSYISVVYIHNNLVNNHRNRSISTVSSLQVCPRSCLLSSGQSSRDSLHILHRPNPRTWETCLREKQYLVCGNQITLRSCVLCKHVSYVWWFSEWRYNTRSKVACQILALSHFINLRHLNKLPKLIVQNSEHCLTSLPCLVAGVTWAPSPRSTSRRPPASSPDPSSGAADSSFPSDPE